ncbi:MAG: cell wall hydrolase [Oscillospiraceae bacterium]|nr:cell wall hydrolase [Oscillospiraceae bacterium]MBQ6902596.1 cell wall hydrolase [Oscillospiraceae bacterium]
MKRIIIFFLFVFSVFRLTYAANVSVDGIEFDGAKLIDSVTYVPLRSFSEGLSSVDVDWDGENRAAEVTGENLSLTARIGDSFIKCNDRFLYSGKQNIIIDGSTFVPIRALAKTFGATVVWDNATRTAHVTSGAEAFKSADEFYNATDLYWLSKIINAESGGESLVGKIAVGNVVLNRVKSNEFPNSVYDVIFDKKGGVQFTPVANGSIYKEASEESIMAAKICLEDYKLSNKNILFFLNPAISTSTWVPDNRDFVMTIGRHDFYA